MKVREIRELFHNSQEIEMYYVKEENVQYYLGIAHDIPEELDELNVTYMCAGEGDCPKYQGYQNILLVDAYDDAALERIRLAELREKSED